MKTAQLKSSALAFLASLVFIHFQIGTSYILAGNVLTDLTATDSTFSGDASSWTLSSWYNPSNPNKVYVCAGTYLLGGPTILGGARGNYFQRVYSGLPAHNLITFSFYFQPIDSWDGYIGAYGDGVDGFKMSFDATTYDGWSMGDLSYKTQLCSWSWPETPAVKATMQVPHSATSLTLRIISWLDQTSDDESFGFRDIKMVFTTVASPAYSICGVSDGAPLGHDPCPCPNDHYFMKPAQSGTCVVCSDNCKTCSGAATTCTACYDGQYLSSGVCYTCNPKCKTCSGSLETQCTSCPVGQYLQDNGMCVATCDLPLIADTTNPLALKCSRPNPCAGTYIYWDAKTCTSTCDAPLIVQTYNSYSLCTHPCGTSGEYVYWTGSCSPTCDSPLLATTLLGRNLCGFPCSGATPFLNWNNACAATCTAPYVTRTDRNKKYCDYPCKATEYLYWDGTCQATCPFASKRTTSSKNFCDYPCTGSQYLNFDNTCQASCTSPLSPRTVGTYKYCDHPCLKDSTFLYWDGTCASTCASPLTSRVQGTAKFCDFKCTGLTPYLTWDGSCKATCDAPFVKRTWKTKTFCDFGCKASEYSYWNITCATACDFPLSIRKVDNNAYCDYNCASDQYLYYNGSCLKTCSTPFTQKKEGTTIVKNFCVINCAAGEFLYKNGSCSSSCPSPYKQIVDFGYKRCQLPCDGNAYYSTEKGVCVSECEFPYTLNLTDSYLSCLPPVTGTGVFSMFFEAPLQASTFTVVKPVKAMQYLKYLDIKLPPRLQRFAISKGRNVASVGSSSRLLEENIITQTLPSVFDKHKLSSNFFDDFSDSFIYLMIALGCGIVFYIIEKIALKKSWIRAELIFMRLRVITKWNLFLMMLATSTDDIILYSSIQYRALIGVSDISGYDIFGVVLSATFLFLILGLLILSYSVARKLRKLKMSIPPDSPYKTQLIEEFTSKWRDYQIIFRGFKENHALNQYFFLMYTLRILVPMLVTVCAVSIPGLIVAVHLITNCAILLYMIVMKPFKKSINHIQLVLLELIVLMMNVSMLVLVIFDKYDVQNDDASAVLGDIIIFGNDISNILILVFLAIKVVLEFLTIRKLQKVRPESKTRYIQLLGLLFQQANLKFEELIEDDPYPNTPKPKPQPRKKQSAKIHTELDLTDKSSPSLKKIETTTLMNVTDVQQESAPETLLHKSQKKNPRIAIKTGAEGTLPELEPLSEGFSPVAASAVFVHMNNRFRNIHGEVPVFKSIDSVESPTRLQSAQKLLRRERESLAKRKNAK